MDQTLELVVHDLRKTQPLQVIDLGVALVQDPHDHALAIHGGQRRNSKIDVLAENSHLDSAVLGNPPLGNVELRHDLDSGNDRGLQSGRG